MSLYQTARRERRKANMYSESGFCKYCGTELNPDNWLPSSYINGEYICRECNKKRCSRYYHANSTHLNDKVRVVKFGITLDDLEEMDRQQGGRCKICGGVDDFQRLSIDHDHSTGKVRGLLCTKCNSGLGQFRDDPELLEAAAQYLRDQV